VPGTGALSEDGIADLLRHLSTFRDICRGYGVEQILVIGAAALRAATNREEVRAAVRDALGLDMSVISSDEEAWFGYQAVRHTLDLGHAYLVDIGGGSTEISQVLDGRFVATRSLPFGAVTLGRDWDDRAALTRRLALPAEAQRALDQVSFLDPAVGADVIGIGGTVRTLARIHQGRVNYPLRLTHNYRVPVAEFTEVLRSLAAMPLDRRRKTEGMARERADVIVPGGALLLAILRKAGAAELRVSGRGLRDGVFFARVMGEDGDGPLPVLDRSLAGILERFAVSPTQAAHVRRLAVALFDPLSEAGILPPECRPIVIAASTLHRVGVGVSFYGLKRHTFYVALNSEIHGLSHREALIAALAAAYQSRGKMRRMAQPVSGLLTEADQALVAQLGILTRLAEAFDCRRDGRVAHLEVTVRHQSILVRAKGERDLSVEWEAARAVAAHAAREMGREVRIGVIAPST
jgi:exopolyphosphatase/guanosine-5'-triphosphate,3'-diphosphate pyrophosphatase